MDFLISQPLPLLRFSSVVLTLPAILAVGVDRDVGHTFVNLEKIAER
jgi:hypothetical protein